MSFTPHPHTVSDSTKASYGQILKSTALIGGSQALNILIGMVRVKALALLLGPAGIGLAGMYQAATAMIATVSGLGIGVAGVRQIAEAEATGDDNRIARTVALLRRSSWISGLLGMALVLVFAKPLTIATFGDDHYVGGVALVSLTLLFGGISTGQLALLQGLRRLKDLAACNLLGALFGTVASIGLVYFFRNDGVAPFLVTVAGFGILTSWWYARKVAIPHVHLPWRETLDEARPLLGLGASFIATGLIGAGITYLIRIMIIHELGMHAIGLFTASSNISLLYIGIVINAMGADFYPRLTAIANQHRAVNKLVNQQAEMGMLLALPGLLATILLAPWVMKIFYSGEFVAAAELIRWQILGMGLRVACWPLGYIFLAKGMGKTLVIIEAISAAVHAGLIYLCMHIWGLDGCGIGFLLYMILFTLTISLLGNKTTRFKWSRHSLNVLLTSTAFTVATLFAVKLTQPNLALAVGLTILAAASAWCISRLNRALGTNILSALRGRLLSRPKADTDVLGAITAQSGETDAQAIPMPYSELGNTAAKPSLARGYAIQPASDFSMDVIVKSFNRPYYLDRCLCSIERHLKGLRSIRILDDGTPNRYLEEIKRRHPGIEIVRSARYTEKSNYVEHYIPGNATPPRALSLIPWDLWIANIRTASLRFLLLEDDLWYTKGMDLEAVGHLMDTHHCALVRLFRCPVFDCGAVSRLSPEISKVAPWYLKNRANALLYNAYLKNQYKVASILRRLGLPREQWQLEAYAVYVVTGIFEREFWLNVTAGAGGEINERMQLANAVEWATKNPNAVFARAEDDYLTTTFRSSSASSSLDKAVGFDMFLFNRLINEQWLAGRVDACAGMPGDFPPDVFLSVLENAAEPRCSVEQWSVWCNQFSESFRNLGRTIE